MVTHSTSQSPTEIASPWPPASVCPGEYALVARQLIASCLAGILFISPIEPGSISDAGSVTADDCKRDVVAIVVYVPRSVIFFSNLRAILLRAC